MATKYSKRHYQHLARFLKSQQPENPYRLPELSSEASRARYRYWEQLVFSLADELTEDSQRFNRLRFLAACGVVKTLAEVFAEHEHPAQGLPRLTVSDLPALERFLQE
jgi:hypothetical protein